MAAPHCAAFSAVQRGRFAIRFVFHGEQCATSSSRRSSSVNIGRIEVAFPEAFVPGHKHMADAELMRAHPLGPVSPLRLFVCTYVAKLSNLV